MTSILKYRDNLQNILNDVFDRQAELLETVARDMCDCVSTGHMIYLFGTGHAHILVEEMFYRAGGLAAVQPILDEKLMLHVSASGSTEEERRTGCATELLDKYNPGVGDILFVCSNSGRNTAPVEMAIEAAKRGMKVIAITNVAHSLSCLPRNPYGKRLLDVADCVLDNGGAIGDASMNVGLPYKVGATSTAVGAALLQALTSRCVEIAINEECSIDVFCSSNVDGGDEINEAILQKYCSKIACL